jgi:hypothetical protein
MPMHWLKSLFVLRQRVKEFRLLAERCKGHKLDFFNEVKTHLNILSCAISLCEDCEIQREIIIDEFRSVQHICSRSPFLQRLQTWPRGYPGDFETVEYIINRKNHAEPDTIEYWLEQNGLDSDITQQHRNKVVYQANTISRTLKVVSKRNTSKPRILILACGGCPDLRMIQQQVTKYDCLIVINDMDRDAILFASDKLTAIHDKLIPVQGNALRCCSRLAKHGPYDLIVAGGLFDYLPDRHARFLLGTIWNRLLRHGGQLLFTNIATENAFRVWVEYFVNWKLIERSISDITELLHLSGIETEKAQITREQTGLTLLVDVSR